MPSEATKFLIDMPGWAGAILLLGAYACVSFKKLRADSIAYQLINGLGSCCLVVNTVFYRAYPSAFVNVVWIAIALTAGVRARTNSEETVRLDG
jgi:hypothetical protein